MGMPEVVAMKATTDPERKVLRAVLDRGNQKYSECPCGWFYSGARCPDPFCKEWKRAHGTKRTKLYAHASKDDQYQEGGELGLDGEPLKNFVYWGCELVFDADVDMETGNVTLLTVNGHKISSVKG